jgi:hypothetical protein
MTLLTMIGGGVPTTVVSFGAAALAAGAVVAGLLIVTAAVLIVVDFRMRGVTPVAPVGARRLEDARYLEQLEARDGAPDLDCHQLARRETLLRGLRPLRSVRAVDPAAYRRNLARRTPERDLDPLMLWLLATAKVNQAERFAVGLAELYGRLDESDPVRIHITLQEVYHTRLLAGVVSLFGLTVRPRPPAWPTRLFVKLLLALPERWQLPLTGAAEMAGCVLFRALGDRGVELVAAEPAVAARVRLLYDQILSDEIGHVGYVTRRLGPAGRAVMRGLYRLLGPYFVATLPELTALFGREDLRRRFRQALPVGGQVSALRLGPVRAA